jgi:hypothetical protein
MSSSSERAPSERAGGDGEGTGGSSAGSAAQAPADPGRGTISRRAFLAGAGATPVALWLGGKLPEAAAEVAGSGPIGACALSHDVLLRCWRGYDRARSGQILIVPHGKNFFGGYSHATPYPYTQDVPMWWYGPGFIKNHNVVTRPVTSADVAPTISRLIGFDFQAPDGRAMREALIDRPAGASLPKLVVVLVWDAGGRYVLDDLHPGSWPNLAELKKMGTWYENATVGSNPSNTAPVHATIGAGAFPRRHGVADNIIRMPSGRLIAAWGTGPDFLRGKFLAEEYLKAVGSEARVGVIGTVAWHMGMVGRGSFAGAPKPIAVLKVIESSSERVSPPWGVNPAVAPYFRFPDYVTDPSVCPRISTFFPLADAVDGRKDGTWRGHDIASQLGGFHTPARIPYQARVVEQVVKREGFGTHASPDLLFINFKLIDEVGHLYSASSLEMRDSVKVQDRHLASFIDFMDNTMGLKGEWVLLLTADHGHTAHPSVGHGLIINGQRVMDRIQQRFDSKANGRPIVQQFRPTWLELDQQELEANGVTYDKISNLVARTTRADNSGPGAHLLAEQAQQLVFDAAFAGDILGRLPCLPEAHTG